VNRQRHGSFGRPELPPRPTFLRQRPLSKGMQVIMDDNPIIWLTKDLVS
jgi:hypothetical protein